MNARSDRNEKMPYGVGEWDEPIALEEGHAHHIEDASQSQLAHTCAVHLWWSRTHVTEEPGGTAREGRESLFVLQWLEVKKEKLNKLTKRIAQKLNPTQIFFILMLRDTW